jgi:hypothetical protein
MYFLNEKKPLILKDVELNNQFKDAKFIFIDRENTIVKKRIKKTKLPNSVYILNSYKGNDLFFKMKGNIRIVNCNEIEFNDKLEDIKIEITNPYMEDQKTSMILKIKDLIIRPRNIYLTIGKNNLFRESEINIIKWLIKEQCRAYIFLKKPVNNLEIGYISFLEYCALNESKNINNNFIRMKNIFGRTIDIPYRLVESISFDYKTAVIQLKKETSLFSKLGYKIQKRIKPQKIMYLNKV